jgi:hypothetical protein
MQMHCVLLHLHVMFVRSPGSGVPDLTFYLSGACPGTDQCGLDQVNNCL